MELLVIEVFLEQGGELQLKIFHPPENKLFGHFLNILKIFHFSYNFIWSGGFPIFNLLSTRSSMSGQKRRTNETSTYSFSSWTSQYSKFENSLNNVEYVEVGIYLIVLKNQDY